MKTSFSLLCAFALVFCACSPDDDSSNNNGSSVYLPLTDANYWTYDVTGSLEGTTGRDSLYVANDTIINAQTYKKMKSRSPRFGFFSGLFHQAAVRKSGSKLVATGTNNFSFAGQVPIGFTLSDFVIFDADASQNTTLDSDSGTTTQTFDNIPLTINYTITSKAGAHYPSWTASDGTVYQDVTTSTYVVSMKVTATFEGVPFPITVADTQDVLNSTLYYAAGVGVVTANTAIQYQLQDFSALGVSLPIPQSSSQSMLEVLDTFQVAN
ncbi:MULTISPECIES: hypothetical protein [unclassified Flavobacterium]|uniref:hypothetical protein n=1 Tax=unclassified Flavobacterium TaxID=196869 RepID=UPI001F12E3CA|nr:MULTISPECIES: hypothetical protein [unclassified Flavobacterium]UMY65050.1 hypothetical protein MKO97_11060 [Flavobacterium sp. HJ-32-4]